MKHITNDYRDNLSHEIKNIRKLSYLNHKDELVQAILAEQKDTDIYAQEQEKIRKLQKTFRENNELEKIFATKKPGELIYFTETGEPNSELKNEKNRTYFSSGIPV